MKSTIKYKETMKGAVEAMMESAIKDEFADKKTYSKFPKAKKREISLKDVRAMNIKRKKYQESTGIAINAMMESAINDIFVDTNKPSLF